MYSLVTVLNAIELFKRGKLVPFVFCVFCCKQEWLPLPEGRRGDAAVAWMMSFVPKRLCAPWLYACESHGVLCFSVFLKNFGSPRGRRLPCLLPVLSLPLFSPADVG